MNMDIVGADTPTPPTNKNEGGKDTQVTVTSSASSCPSDSKPLQIESRILLSSGSQTPDILHDDSLPHNPAYTPRSDTEDTEDAASTVGARKKFVFLHSIGLDVLNGYYNKWKLDQAAPEPKKQIIDIGLKPALSRCVVHIIPVCVTIVLLWFNLHGFFIGFELAGIPGLLNEDMALLQITAKMQELLIVGSLATVILHKVRHDLLKGQGLPFGLLGSGSSFSELSFFWAPEFISAVRGRSTSSKQSRSKWALIALLAVSGLIATFAGPSVAVLLIPRIAEWSAGSADYYVNGTAEDLWPTQVGLHHYLPNGTIVGNGIDCSSASGYSSAFCPNSGYISLLDNVRSILKTADIPLYEMLTFSATPTGSINSTSLYGSGIGMLVHSAQGLMASYTMSGSVRGRFAIETSSVGFHGASSNPQLKLNLDWYEKLPRLPGVQQYTRYQYYSSQLSSIQTQVPAVRVVCYPASNLTTSSNTVSFPIVPVFGPGTAMNGTFWGKVDIALDPKILGNHTFTTSPRISFVNSTGSTWSNMTTAMVFESPWIDNDSRLASGCLIDARWASATVFNQFPQAFQSQFNDVRENDGLDADIFMPKPGTAWRQIYVDDAWLSGLNFVLPPNLLGSLPNGTTSLEGLIMSTGLKLLSEELISDSSAISSLNGVEHVIASSFADALSRIGAFRSFNTSVPVSELAQFVYFDEGPDYAEQLFQNGGTSLIPPSVPAETYTTLTVQQTITGYAYRATSVTDYLAIAIVLGHLVLALLHTLVLLRNRRSSGAWSSIPELLALAQQSRPSATALRNTAAGVANLDTFARRAHIGVLSDDMGHVELYFEHDNEKDLHENVKEESRYG